MDETKKLFALVLALIGISCLIGGIVPIARPDAPFVFLLLVPLGIASISVAVPILGSFSQSAVLDSEIRKAVLRLAVGTASAGLLSSWLALSIYKGAIMQIGGVAAGGALLFCATILLGGWYGRGSSI